MFFSTPQFPHTAASRGTPSDIRRCRIAVSLSIPPGVLTSKGLGNFQEVGDQNRTFAAECHGNPVQASCQSSAAPSSDQRCLGSAASEQGNGAAECRLKPVEHFVDFVEAAQCNSVNTSSESSYSWIS